MSYRNRKRAADSATLPLPFPDCAVPSPSPKACRRRWLRVPTAAELDRLKAWAQSAEGAVKALAALLGTLGAAALLVLSYLGKL